MQNSSYQDKLHGKKKSHAASRNQLADADSNPNQPQIQNNHSIVTSLQTQEDDQQLQREKQ